MSDSRKPIDPNPPRWKPNPDPSSIPVPGLDTNASVLEQIEQMEQLITIKLQNIDENFSKIHNVLASKLLPAVKRYAVGTEPVREAAKFWTSFYEQAAQIRIPTYDDYSTVNEMPSEREELDTTTMQEQPDDSRSLDVTLSRQNYEPSIVNTESSFMPGQGAFSSTPATARIGRVQDSFTTNASDEPSWTASMESPLVRLNREIQSLSTNDEPSFAPSSSKIPSMRINEPTPDRTTRPDDSILPRSEKGKAKDSSQPLLHNLLRHNLYSASGSSPGLSSHNISPLKFRGKPKTPIPKELNPYLPDNADPSEWSGVVDLRDSSALTPERFRSARKPTSSHRTTTPGAKAPKDDDDSFDGLPPGMSPPRLMSPARPPRSSAELGLHKLGQTPGKEASARITRDLLRDIQVRSGGGMGMYGYANSVVESSMSTVPTPPSLSRYQRYNADTSESLAGGSSFESMLERVGLNIPSSKASTPGLRIRPRVNQTMDTAELVVAPSPPPAEAEEVPWTTPGDPIYSQDDVDSDSDSMDEINNTAHPSAAFLMASQGHSDDSFGSSNHSSDSLADEGADLGIAPVHPFAGAVQDDGFDDDDSFDDDVPGGSLPVEETVFGLAPAQRLQADAMARQAERGNLRMLGTDLLQDTLGIGNIRNAVDESPTPAGWGGNKG
ncbi:hypothetical protein BDQ12DRAFT_732813 [Crucibulum laeve]|uniref:DASH complex subunit ASK1 n=1 Tax=Crucibulum laeve TaxID=68775 RepID=A0A5C3MBQ8_9AGAR|nr:hypothetical protein BDQ12DRAFT_732813 [Crucibulum laeve]